MEIFVRIISAVVLVLGIAVTKISDSSGADRMLKSAVVGDFSK